MDKILESVWNVYKEITAWSFLIILTLLIIVGGEFTLKINWENISHFWHSITRK